jgi:hypothetical protein
MSHPTFSVGHRKLPPPSMGSKQGRLLPALQQPPRLLPFFKKLLLFNDFGSFLSSVII